MNKRAAVIGCGVVGLTTALVLQENGWQVTVITNHSINKYGMKYTSDKAGAHWFSFAAHGDLRQQEFDRITYEKFSDIAKKHPESGVYMPMGNQVFATKPKDWKDYWWSTLAPEWSLYSKEELAKKGLNHVEFGIRYRAIMMPCDMYMPWLQKQFENAGGVIVEKSLWSLSEAAELCHAQLVVNCSGNGASVLEDVNDAKVYAVRGQTLLVKAPEIKEIWRKPGSTDATPTYILPRGDGLVVLGGTFDANEIDDTPNPAVAKSILSRCAELVPSLADIHLPILAHKVGLRPARVGGIRLEMKKPAGQPYTVIHNYGHGGYGYQSSWGCAAHVLKLAQSIEGVGVDADHPAHISLRSKL